MNLSELIVRKNKSNTIYFENNDGQIVAKECRVCGKPKFINEFSKGHRYLGGVMSECKACKSQRNKRHKENNPEYYQKYYKDNKAKITSKSNKFYSQNKEHVRNRVKEYYENNKEKVQEYKLIYRKENKEKISIAQREYYEKNKDRKISYQRDYYRNNREDIAVRHKEYYENNRSRIIYNATEWARNNPIKRKIIIHRRRSRKYALPNNFTKEHFTEVLEVFGDACALTSKETDLHWDHAIPLATGHGGTTCGNMYPLRSDLNQSKGDRNIFEWFEANRQRFELSQERFDNLIAWLASANAMSVGEYRDYVYWCHDNPRTIDDLKGDDINAAE